MTATIAFDPYSPEVLKAGPPAYSALKKAAPFYHYKGKFDFYINSDYDEIRNVILKDHTTWSFKDGPGPVDASAMRGTGISTDPPVHDHFRRVIQRGFSPKKLEGFSKDVDRIADELIDKMLADPKGEGDFFEVFAKPLPSRLMCIMLGTPEANWPKYKVWSDEQIVQLMNADDAGRVDEITREFAPHFFGLVNERKELLRKAGVTIPSLEHVGTILPDDFMSRYICDRVDGRPLEDMEVLGLGMSILGAGNETTINQITNLLWRLLEVPSRWEFLKANPHLIENALEESLRYDPPVLGMMRKCVKDTEMKGHKIKAGERVFYSIAGANREERLWDDPDEFRIDRPLNGLLRHITFGGGNHVCLGLALARMETKQVFQRLVARLPNLRLTGEPERIKVFNFWGRSSLPVAWK